jgi:D-alanine transaminase
MVFLNGEFVEQKHAKISTLDRGFLFGDGVYEVIPVYHGTIFALENHLQRLADNLGHTHIPNPYTHTEYTAIFNTLLEQHSANEHQVIYLQITRGVGEKRQHSFQNLTPTVYIRTDTLHIKNEDTLKQGYQATLQKDIRWHHCNIKSTSLLASVLYTRTAQEMGVEEVILHRNNIITEGGSSNVFIVSNGVVTTPPKSNDILAGITRDMVLKSCEIAGIVHKEENITTQELWNADEVWISSSTREIMPLACIDTTSFDVATPLWQQVYNTFQTLKNV